MKKILLTVLLLFSIASATEKPSLYIRLGGYDTIATVLEDFHIRLKNDSQLLISFGFLKISSEPQIVISPWY